MNTQMINKESQQQEPARLWNMMFISIFFANMAMNLGQIMSNSLLSVYANSFGASVTSIGMLMSTIAISAIFFRMISGPAMDTYNRKYIVIMAMLTMAVSYFGFSMSKSIVSLMCFRFLQGAGMAFGNACCLAMVAETLPKDKYGSGIGYYSLAGVVSASIGPLVGLWLVELVGYNKTFIINAAIMLFAAFLASRIRISFKQTKKLKISLNNIIAKEALLPSFLLIFLTMAFCLVNSFLIIFAGEQGVTENIGLFFTVSAVTMLFTRPAVGRLTDKHGFVKVFIPALLCDVVAFFIISVSNNLWTFLLASFVHAFGFGACQPAVQTLTMKNATSDRRGAASSTNFIGMDIGNLIGPMIAGSIAQSFGYVVMWRVMVIPLLIAVSLAFFFRDKITRIEQNFIVDKAA
jgi:MFS family permease